MQIAIHLYDKFTALDAIGPYQMLSGLPGAEVVLVARQPGPVQDDNRNLTLIAHRSFGEVPRPDILVTVGSGEPDLTDETALAWLRSADAHTTWTASVCTGSLILGAAGLLKGRRATSHWLALDRLRDFGAEPTGERVVFDGKYVTAAGVSAGIDMGLALAGRVAGDRHAQTVQLMTEYDPEPPYDAGSPAKAPADLVAHLRTAPRSF
ncbi:DJ-1/PfpI family protein [Streptomyces sp. MUM 203J]|uniref:DJ-1/PfpI family protein n=1 Tax=Streptomyces sp. MUM 203J TaxID=2791990 RepID=UPI001F03AA45|nr:DJ-1/PfpI family protein [Streptomyces sp. MUM 203J]MCH0541907.1 DJ-1/PfpI family protein [Streptomyces sp. MUM 203J]